MRPCLAVVVDGRCCFDVDCRLLVICDRVTRGNAPSSRAVTWVRHSFASLFGGPPAEQNLRRSQPWTGTG